MPLASSRTASQKRAKVLAEKKEQEKRRERRLSTRRQSLPSSCRSTTVVNEAKARRRMSMRQKSDSSLQRKENEAPEDGAETGKTEVKGNMLPPSSSRATPYFVVAQERGMSPPQTRSAKKKKRSDTAMFFSPPDQEANKRREEQRLEEEEKEHKRRVQEAIDNKRLLVYSPSLRPLDLSPDAENNDSNLPKFCLDMSPPNGASRASAASKDTSTSSMTGSHDQSSSGQDLIKALRDLMDKRDGSDQTCQQLVAELTKRDQKTEQLENELKTVNDTWRREKEDYLVKTTKLEADLEGAKQQSIAQVKMLKEAQDRLDDQLQHVRAEKDQLLRQLHQLENQLHAAENSTQKAEAEITAMQEEAAKVQKELEIDCSDLQDANAALEKQIEGLQRSVDASNDTIKEYKALKKDLETKLRQSEKQLTCIEKDLSVKEKSVRDMESAVKEYQNTIDDLEHQLAGLREETLRQKTTITALSEQSEQSAENLAKEITERDIKIGELFRQLGEKQKDLQMAEEALDKLSAEHEENEKKLRSQTEELNRALEETMAQLQEIEKQNLALQKEVGDLEAGMAKEQESKAAVQSELEAKHAKITELEQAIRDAGNKLTHLDTEKEKLIRQVSSMEEQMNDKEQEHCRILQDLEDRLETTLEERAKDSALAARLRDLERQLKQTQKERDDALQNMAGFNERDAENFRKIQEYERIRREYHNKLMQLAGNIRVFVRVRPTLPSEEVVEKNKKDSDSKKRKRQAPSDEEVFSFPGVYERDGKKPNQGTASSSSADDLTKNLIIATEPYKDRGGLSDRRKKWRFGFDQVFSPNHGQDDVWEATEPLVQSAVDGFNVTIFAYGQTGSGKTYTMLGEEGEQGVVGRAVAKLFQAQRELYEVSRGGTNVTMSVELLEVYNEQVRDLLAPNSGPNGRELPLKVTSKEVVGNIRVTTKTQVDVMKVLALAQSRRCVKATASNAESSRSHLIFTIHFETTMKDGTTRAGKLNVCDLAGSERLSKSGAHLKGGALFEETKHINKSLMVLSNVIEKLQAGDKNIPFRESKLTMLLQNSLGGNSKTLAIVCCSPAVSHFHESVCSLKFAEKVNKVDLKAIANFSC